MNRADPAGLCYKAIVDVLGTFLLLLPMVILVFAMGFGDVAALFGAVNFGDN